LSTPGAWARFNRRGFVNITGTVEGLVKKALTQSAINFRAFTISFLLSLQGCPPEGCHAVMKQDHSVLVTSQGCAGRAAVAHGT